MARPGALVKDATEVRHCRSLSNPGPKNKTFYHEAYPENPMCFWVMIWLPQGICEIIAGTTEDNSRLLLDRCKPRSCQSKTINVPRFRKYALPHTDRIASNPVTDERNSPFRETIPSSPEWFTGLPPNCSKIEQYINWVYTWYQSTFPIPPK
jgi:hypothetical protein